MSDKLTKNILLEKLKTIHQPFSLSVIRSHLEPLPSDRTLRRWLNDFVEQGTLTRSGQNKGTRYKLPSPYSKHQFLIGLDADIQKTVLNQIRNLWTHHSTALEGNTLSLGDTQFILDGGLTISGKPLKEHQEIYGHASAIELVYQILNRTISENDLFQLHLAVQTEKVTDIYKPNGSWKVEINGTYAVDEHSQQVFIEYANPLHVQKLMRQLIDELNTLCSHTLSHSEGVKAYAKIHLGFVHIHPFWDGNGRLARLIANIPLLKSGLPPIVIQQKDRQTYLKTLARYQIKLGQLTPVSGVWPDIRELLDFEKFCDNSYSETLTIIEKAQDIQKSRINGV